MGTPKFGKTDIYGFSKVNNQAFVCKEKTMLALEGIYQNNQLILNQKVSFSKPVKVIVTFLEETPKVPAQKSSFVLPFEKLAQFRALQTLSAQPTLEDVQSIREEARY